MGRRKKEAKEASSHAGGMLEVVEELLPVERLVPGVVLLLFVVVPEGERVGEPVRVEVDERDGEDAEDDRLEVGRVDEPRVLVVGLDVVRLVELEMERDAVRDKEEAEDERVEEDPLLVDPRELLELERLDVAERVPLLLLLGRVVGR